jgi:hypothetical protein
MKVFLDCDGVLADFDRVAFDLCGKTPRLAEDKAEAAKIWKALRGQPDFFFMLPKMHDADILVQGVRALGFDPVILTGVPLWEEAEEQKLCWGREHFPSLKMVTCRSSEKSLQCERGDVLIDDWDRYKSNWENSGGVFILHKSAEESLKALADLLR